MKKKIGDKVRLSKGTTLWNDWPDLHATVGEIVDINDNGSMFPPVCVLFDDGNLLCGIHPGSVWGCQ